MNRLLVICLVVLVCSVQIGHTESTKPLWELGLFNGWARIPDYRGSDEYRSYILPLPYFIYRGDIIRSDREGVRGIFLRTERFETSLSLSGNPPVSDDNKAREGMEELDAVLEAGPAAKWYFLGRHPVHTFYLRTALRGVMSIGVTNDWDVGYQGFRGAMNLIYVNQAPFGNDLWRVGLNAGIDAADQRYHDYFYEVKASEAIPGRPAYRPDGGFGGVSLSGSLVRRLTRNFSLASYLRWTNSSWAAFRDSPLVETENNYVFGAALIWRIWTSRTQVDTRYIDPDE